MKLSKEGIALLKQIEVLALLPYDDQLSLKSAPIKERLMSRYTSVQ